MSGIAGIFNLDGRPVETPVLRRMLDRITHRGPDSSGGWTQGAVGLGHRMLHSTPESLREKQPAIDETGNLCLTLDGRVDNRSDLQAALEGKGLVLRDATDAELILRAYECWGEDCPSRIIGDFAFAIWDGRQQRLFCARDPLGIRPFYYYTDGRTFVFGSELQQLFAHPTVRPEPNEGMIGEYLADSITSQEDTLFRNLVRLPPAHWMIVAPGRLRKTRYWDIDPHRTLCDRSDDAYAEHFLSILKEAVRCRLRSHGPIAADLSGGLDSSSVVSLSHALFRAGLAHNTGFETFSLVFPGLPCDESPYIRSVADQWGITNHQLLPKPVDLNGLSDHIGCHQDFPDYPNQTMSDSLAALAKAKGCRIVLTGIGGDDWLDEGLPPYADFLRQGRFIALCKEAWQDSLVLSPLTLAKRTCSPLLPRWLRHARAKNRAWDGVPTWINRDFARRIHLADRLRGQFETDAFTSYAHRDMMQDLRSGKLAHMYEMVDRSSFRFGLESRHPFNDRRMIEFALALPRKQRQRDSHTKFILREGLRGLLPEAVRTRSTKAEFSFVFAQAFQTLGGQDFFEALAIAPQGWVEPKPVLRLYQEMTHHDGAHRLGQAPHLWPLWMIAGIELWVKTVLSPRRRTEDVVQPAESAMQPL